MQINFGIDTATVRSNNPKNVIWDTHKIINGHMLMMGKSGTGKTYTIKKIINQMFDSKDKKNFRVHMIDVHGDMDMPGASTVKFSEATDYGLNPLAVNPDPDFGGVRKRIQSFMSAINKTSRKLGSKQEAALRNILFDLYAANGFYDGKPDSWRLKDGVQRKYPKKHPTVEDALRFSSFKLKSMFLGTSSKCVSSLEELNKKSAQLHNKQKQLHKANNETDIIQLQGEIEKLGEKTSDLFKEHIEELKTGMELDDLIKYNSREVMKSVVEKLENINAIGIFKQRPPPFDKKNPIWRYDIKALFSDEKKLFVYFLLEAIFLRAVQRGVQDDIVEVIVLDEAHLFFDDDQENIINTIAKEARKFGLGLICASQSPTHFSDDFIANVGTKIILGIDQMYWDGSIRKLKIDQKALDWIVPHQKMVMQINNKGQMKNNFTWVGLRD